MFNSYLLLDVKFRGNCLINSNISVFRKVISLHISYKLDTWSRYLNTDFTLGTYLFGTAKSTENADPNKYGYNCYGIGFNAPSQFFLPDGSWGKMSLLLELIIVLL